MKNVCSNANFFSHSPTQIYLLHWSIPHGKQELYTLYYMLQEF